MNRYNWIERLPGYALPAGGHSGHRWKFRGISPRGKLEEYYYCAHCDGYYQAKPKRVLFQGIPYHLCHKCGKAVDDYAQY